MKYRYSRVMTEHTKDPARKRTFNPEPDVAPLLKAWELENRHVIFSRMINEALRLHLRPYRFKKDGRNGRKVAA